jgi:hypothetical protein
MGRRPSTREGNSLSGISNPAAESTRGSDEAWSSRWAAPL